MVGETVPFRSNSLSLGALLELPQRVRTEVGEVVGAGVGNDGVPDDGLVGGVDAGPLRRPLGRHVDEDLLGVPRK